MLVDLCDNPKVSPSLVRHAMHTDCSFSLPVCVCVYVFAQTLVHVTSWNGSEQVWVWSLLSRLWREEEKELGVPRDMMGTLAGQSMAHVRAHKHALYLI